MDSRFDQMDDRLDKLEARLDARLESVETRLERIEIKLEATSEQVARNTKHDSSFDELAVTVARHTTDIILLKKLAAIS